MSKAFNTKELGKQGEDLVAQQLIKQGYNILQRNYYQKFGEIDLIAQKDDVIAFIEVKSRNSNYFNLSEVITLSKQKKIILTAKKYILDKKYVNKIFRFDVAFVEKVNDNLKINYISNAFTENN